MIIFAFNNLYGEATPVMERRSSGLKDLNRQIRRGERSGRDKANHGIIRVYVLILEPRFGPRALGILDKCYTTEIHTSAPLWIFHCISVWKDVTCDMGQSLEVKVAC